MSESNAREIQIPVPWGIIAGKSWNDPCLKPALLLHGIQDNLGSFERLIPYLPQNYFYVAIDLPGHGLSTRLPRGFPLEFVQHVFSINRVIRHLNWNSFSLIGHSLGGQIALYYTAMFPEQVEKLVVLDALGPSVMSEKHYFEQLRDRYEKHLETEKKLLDGEPPSYSYEVALDKSILSRRTPISRPAAETLIKRNLKQGKNGYYFAPDQRLKAFLVSPLTENAQLRAYGSITCPFLLVYTQTTMKFLETLSEYARSLEAFRKNPKFELVVVSGYHDVHNDNPELVGGYVHKFLIKQLSKI